MEHQGQKPEGFCVSSGKIEPRLNAVLALPNKANFQKGSLFLHSLTVFQNKAREYL